MSILLLAGQTSWGPPSHHSLLLRSLQRATQPSGGILAQHEHHWASTHSHPKEGYQTTSKLQAFKSAEPTPAQQSHLFLPLETTEKAPAQVSPLHALPASILVPPGTSQVPCGPRTDGMVWPVSGESMTTVSTPDCFTKLTKFKM